MLIYWLLLAVPALTATLSNAIRGSRRSQVFLVLSILFWIFYNTVSALRFEVGGDWNNYARMLDYIRLETLATSIGYTEFGFVLVMKLSEVLHLGMAGVNLFSSGMLSIGVITIARRTQYPWLAIMASVPYLFIVVGMGYLQQSAAIGFLMLGTAALFDRRIGLAVSMGLIACSMHIAALVYLPLVAFVFLRESRLFFIPVALAGIAGLGILVSAGYWDKLTSNYIEAGYSSNGALVRLLMNAVPAAIFLMFRRNLTLDSREDNFWLATSLASLALLLAFYWFPSSTVLDRIGLFLTPIQVFVFGNFSALLRNRKGLVSLTGVALLLYCVAVQFVWLVYADNAGEWVPYRSIVDASAPL